jgi:hypothetical protein
MQPTEVSYSHFKSNLANNKVYYIDTNRILYIYTVFDRKLLKTTICNGSSEHNDFIETLLSTSVDYENSPIILENEVSITYNLDQLSTPTFNIYCSDVDLANTSLISIFNASNNVIRVQKINLINSVTSLLIGSIATFSINKITGHSSGTDLTSKIETYDSNDKLDSLVTIRSNATLSGLSTNSLKKITFVCNSIEVDGLSAGTQQSAFQTFFPIYERANNDCRAITLRKDEGITLNKTSNQTNGSFDIEILFTQELQ